MEDLFTDLDLSDLTIFRREMRHRKPLPELFFDDEPIERILYGERCGGPTSANLYLPAMKYVQDIGLDLMDRKIDNAAKRASELREKGYPMSPGMCLELTSVIREIVPSFPNPILKWDLSGLVDLFYMMWDVAQQSRDDTLKEAVGLSLFRWHEHYGRYEDARHVLKILIDIYRKRRNQKDEATFVNNFAFEYLLEEKFEEATPLFQTAADMFKEQMDIVEYANSRANYLECLLRCGSLEDGDLKAIEKELTSFIPVLETGEAWKVRKPLILLAKIQERKGNRAEAITFVERAIEVCDGRTRYPEMDKEYLEMLKSPKCQRC